MKLVFAIVSKDDSAAVLAGLTREGFFVTKLASTGGFLMSGNTTFMIGTEDEKVDSLIKVLEKYSRRRTQAAPPAAFAYGEMDMGVNVDISPPEVTVGGATVFVTDIERFEKL